MVWTTPKTWVANTKVYDIDLNAFIRDNMGMTMPGKVTVDGQWCVSVGLNEIASRDVSYTLVSSSTTLTTGGSGYQTRTGGPAVTTVTGTAALVIWGCTIDGTSATLANHTVMNTVVPSSVADTWCLSYGDGRSDAAPFRGMSSHIFRGLTKGSNTFTSYYRFDGAGTATFNNRFILVLPL